MAETYELIERPVSEEIYMIVGWRQWADGGSVSSGLPQYLIHQTKARAIGSINPDGFYLFQFPGTHDLVRPAVQFIEGYPVSLTTPHNDLYYSGNERRGVVYFLGDEPQLDVERYVRALLDIAEDLGVKRIIGLGGVYGELPFDKERMISCNYSLQDLKAELEPMGVSFSDYHGGASIGSYVCKRSGERGIEYMGFYAFVPSYDFSTVEQIGNVIRIENDFTSWLAIMRRLNHMLHLGIDLTDLEKKSDHLSDLIESKINEIDEAAPQLNVREYLQNLTIGYTETTFNPLDEVWEEELRRLMDKFEDEDEDKSPKEDED